MKDPARQNSVVTISWRFVRTILVAALAFAGAISPVSAHSVIIIVITTSSSAVAYSLNKESMTPGQLAEWMKSVIEKFGDKESIFIQPDSQTTFTTVFALLENLKASGARHFEIIAERRDSPTATTIRSLSTSADQVKRNEWERLALPK